MGQDHSYDNEWPWTPLQRRLFLRLAGCRDEPVPMEREPDMTPGKCLQHGCALAAMEFQKNRQDLKDWVVGFVQLHLSDHPVVGSAAQ